MTANRLMTAGTLVAAIAGFAIAAYLTSVHYADVPLTCSGSGSVVDCNRVLTSSYSEFMGIPWSVGGIAWFAVSGGFALAVLTRRVEPEWLHPAQVAWSLIGIVTVLYLVGVEVSGVHRICLWCSAQHVLIVVTLLLTLFRTPDEEDHGKVPTQAPRTSSLSRQSK
jgi:uncharacterized membrane protein